MYISPAPSAAFSADGARVVVAAVHAMPTVWNADDGKPVAVIPPIVKGEPLLDGDRALRVVWDNPAGQRFFVWQSGKDRREWRRAPTAATPELVAQPDAVIAPGFGDLAEGLARPSSPV